MENGHQTDAVYTDFSKAFDRVCHSTIVLKLNYFGVRGTLLNWIQSYLTNRRQKVKFQGVLSNEISVSSEVSQGSHLGPILFNISISDVSTIHLSTIQFSFLKKMKNYPKFNMCFCVCTA